MFFTFTSGVFLKFIAEVFFSLLGILGFPLTVKLKPKTVAQHTWHTCLRALKLFLMGPSHSLDSELPELRKHILFAHHRIPRAHSD